MHCVIGEMEKGSKKEMRESTIRLQDTPLFMVCENNIFSSFFCFLSCVAYLARQFNYRVPTTILKF